MATVTRQYRPISTAETAGDDALTVRAIRELADSMNNFKAHMAGPIYKRIGMWWSNSIGSDTEDVVDRVRRPLARGYTNLLFQIQGKMGPSATGNTVWKLYSSSQRYDGPEEFDATYLGPDYSVSTGITISSTTVQCPVAVDDLVPHVDQDGYTHLTLTAENSVSGEYDFSGLISIVATPKVILV